MDGLAIDLYEIYSPDGSQHIVDVWTADQETADKIAIALGGIAHYEMCGIVTAPEAGEHTPKEFE